MYLEFHDVSTGRSSHQACPDILGMFVQCAHVSRVLVVIHHLQTGNKTQKDSDFGPRDYSIELEIDFSIIYWRQKVWRTNCIAVTQGPSFDHCVRAIKIN